MYNYNAIINYVNEMIEGFENFEIVENEEHFAYNMIEDKLYINNEKHDDKEFNTFMINYLKEEFGLEIAEEKLYIFYTLHELGHRETIDKVNYDRYIEEVERLDGNDYLGYRKIFAEYLADNWAACFIDAFGIDNL